MKPLILVLALAGLSQAHAVETAIVPLRNEAQVTVELKLYDRKQTIIDVCMKAGAWPGWNAEQVLKSIPAPGCTSFNLDTKVCTINTLRPRYLEDTGRMENAGHELMHCFYGRYHEQESSRQGL